MATNKRGSWNGEEEELLDSWYHDDDIIEEEEEDEEGGGGGRRGTTELPAISKPFQAGPEILIFTGSDKDLTDTQDFLQQTRDLYSQGDEMGTFNAFSAPSSIATGRYEPTPEDSHAMKFITMDELINIQDMCGQLGAHQKASNHSIKSKMDVKSQHTNIFKQLQRQSSVKSLIHNRSGTVGGNLSQQLYRVSVQSNKAVDNFFDHRGQEMTDTDEEAEDEDQGLSLSVPKKSRSSTRRKSAKDDDNRSPLQRFKDAMGYESSEDEDGIDKLADKLRGVETDEGTEFNDVKAKKQTGEWPHKATLLQAMEWKKKSAEKRKTGEEEEEAEMMSRLPLFLQHDDDKDSDDADTPQDQRQKQIIRNIKDELDFELPLTIKLPMIETAIPIVEGTIKEYTKVLGPHHKMTEEAIERLSELKAMRALYV